MQHATCVQCRHRAVSMSDVHIYDVLFKHNIDFFVCIQQHFGITLQCTPLQAESQIAGQRLADIALCIITKYLASIHFKCYCADCTQHTEIITIIHRAEHVHSIQILCDIHKSSLTHINVKVTVCTCVSSLLAHRLAQIYGAPSGQSAHLAEVVIAAEVRQRHSLMRGQLMGLSVGRQRTHFPVAPPEETVVLRLRHAEQTGAGLG